MTQFKEETMLVHPVVIPGSGTRSWTVLGDDDVPVAPVDRFLAYLTVWVPITLSRPLTWCVTRD